MTWFASETDFPAAKFGLIFLAAIVGILLLAVFGRLAQRRHSRKLERFAEANGLQFTLLDNSWTKTELAAPTSRGSNHKAVNVITGEYRGHRIACFTHTFETGSGDDRTTKYGTITAIELPRELPDLSVRRPQIKLEQMGAIQLESEQFNKAFVVRSSNQKFAYDVLHPRMMQWLLDNNAPGFELRGRYIAHLRWGLTEVDRIPRDVDYVAAIIAAIPPFVLGRGA